MRVCGVVLILGLALGLKAAAQSRVVTQKPIIKLGLKFPDLWIPSPQYCVFGPPTLNATDGILFVTVANSGSAPAPSSSLRVIEKRGEWDTANGPWDFYKTYWATVPPLAPGQQVKISVPVSKVTTGLADSKGKPIKHPRRWFFKADGDDEVFELHESNNGFMLPTFT